MLAVERIDEPSRRTRMWSAIEYVGLMLTAATMFTWLGLRERWPSALGTLLSAAGVQLALTQRVPFLIGMLIAAAGLALIVRDVAAFMTTQPNLAPARALIRRDRSND
jgi:biotin transporter BioY